MAVSLALSNGDSVVAWQTTNGVDFEEFTSNGVPIGAPKLATGSVAPWISLAPSSGGGFTLIWDTTSTSKPVARDYTASGTVTGSAYTLTTAPAAASLAFTSLDAPAGGTSGPWTTLLPNGDTVKVTNSNGTSSSPPSLTIQQYNSAGGTVGPAYVDSIQGLPGLGKVETAALANGNYAVSFVDEGNYGASSYVDLFNAAGQHIARQTVTQTGFQLIQSQSIAGLADGGFVVTWVAASYVTQNLSAPAPLAVFAEEYNAAGTPVTQAQDLGQLASSYTAPEITAFANGKYTIAWTSNGTAQSHGFTEQGAALGSLSDNAVVTPSQNYTVPYGVTDVTLDGTSPQTVTANNSGDTLVSNDLASKLIGGSGNDTLVAGHAANILTGGAGNNIFEFPYLPTSAGTITDFNTATDKLDLSGIFKSDGYTGSNPVGDGWLKFVSDGHGDTIVEINPHSSSTSGWTNVTTLDGVSPSSVTPADYGYTSTTNGTSGGTSGGGSTVDTSAATYTAPAGVTNIVMTGNAAQTVIANNAGDTITSNNYDSTLTGGTGNDTLIAGQDSNTMTGGGGDDTFVFNALPWNNTGVITDFNVNTDVLNLTGIFHAIGYTGTDPVADGYLVFVPNSHGLAVEVNPHTASESYPIVVTTLDNVQSLHTGDWIA